MRTKETVNALEEKILQLERRMEELEAEIGRLKGTAQSAPAKNARPTRAATK